MSSDIWKNYEHNFGVIYTGSTNNIRQTDWPFKEVNDLKLILGQLRNEDELIHTRNKRRIFNFIGELSKILFGI